MVFRCLSVLWVDLCIEERNAQDLRVIEEMGAPHAIRRVGKEEVMPIAGADSADLICLDFDFPDRPGLHLLRRLRCERTAIPVIMLTLQHSESLAVWAFRTGVRDYLVKPLAATAVVDELNAMAAIARPCASDRQAPRQNALNPPVIPLEFRHATSSRDTERTTPAARYVEARFRERIREKDVAALCGMGVSAFCRAFRREHGMTFREFLIRYRIDRAKDLLLNSRLSATDVASLTGFSDPSSFARLFRRYAGETPSRYRAQPSHAVDEQSTNRDA